ncbi:MULTISPECIES: lantibiotic dehydratase [Sphingobacterium]|uniref:Lantibiotic dehydratase n=1 Tax=Sphingobacterium populi TaxID=1812824 RepID=A0ABW5UAZ9_9SPHI|nr:lantibiotic dehydratase [Sphingobacterium sp. CFCC 11742]
MDQRPTKNNELFNMGLYLSSNDLLLEWRKSHDQVLANRSKLELSIYKYWIRSCSRATPYGTFAGCTIVDASDQDSSLSFNSKTGVFKRARLDMNYLKGIESYLRPFLKKKSLLFTNNSLYRIGDHYRYVEYSLNSKVREYSITSAESSDYLDAILLKCRDGITIEMLINSMIEVFPDYTYEDFYNFIEELLDSQILFPDTEMPITSKSLANHINLIAENSEISPLIREGLQMVVNAMDCDNLSFNQLQNIVTTLKSVFPNIPTTSDTLQVDTYFRFDKKNINSRLVDKIVKQTSDLMQISKRNISKDLASFKTRFFKKYEYQEIPLSVALDPDLGVGFSNFTAASTKSEMLDDLSFHQSFTENIIYDELTEFVTQKYNDYVNNDLPEILIIESDIKKISNDSLQKNFPMSTSIIGTLFTKTKELSENGFLFSLNFVGGMSGANLLSRFSHGDDEILSLVKDITRKEEVWQDDAILAEIVHLPQARIGNILLRPPVRSYEIPYVGRSGLPRQNQIDVDDLLISIRGEQVILRSRRLNKRIIPRLTTAHNFANNNLPLYKFLCDLQGQGHDAPILWDWGWLKKMDHLPRVVYKDIIVKKATWRVNIDEFRKEGVLSLNGQDIIQWSIKRKIPRNICVVKNDNYLPIDLASELGAKLFEDELKKKSFLTIEENLSTEFSAPVKDEAGNSYHTEIVIPIFHEFKSNEKSTPAKATDDELSQIEQRNFYPFNKWLYFKLYLGKKTADKFLKELSPKLCKYKSAGLFDKFFFIRFEDSDGHHIRLRFYKEDNKFEMILQSIYTLCAGYIQSGLLSKISIDTYTRELERYGKDLITEAEELFETDSFFILDLLNILNEKEDVENYKILAALKYVDIFVGCFDLTVDQKLELFNQMSKSFHQEFGGDKLLLIQLNKKYNSFQKTIQHIERNDQDFIASLNNLISVKKNEDISIIRKIKKKRVVEDWNFGILSSYIHMSLNRLFMENQRQYELVIYHFLERQYYSYVRRNGAKKVYNDL